MPIIVLLDNSFSMNQDVSSSSSSIKSNFTVSNIETNYLSRFHLAQHGLRILFQFLKNNRKFESTALLTYSRTCEIISEFTRDYDFLTNCLSNIKTIDRSNLMQALYKASKMIKDNYNFDLFCHIIVVTDGLALLQTNQSNKNIFGQFDFEENDLEQLKLPSKCRIHFVCLNTLNNIRVQNSLQTFQEILLKNCQNKSNDDYDDEQIQVNQNYDGGQIWIPDTKTLSPILIEDLFHKLCSENFKSFSGKITCGDLSGLISLYPDLPSINDKTNINRQQIDIIRICGFLNADEMFDSPFYSRHYVIPVAEKNIDEMKKWIRFLNFKSDQSDDDILQMFGDEGRQPSFAVLLHGSFKIANMIAVCEICSQANNNNNNQQQWYGILQSVTDKKKSNLMLFTLYPGSNPIPWLSNFRNFSLSSSDGNTTNSTNSNNNNSKNNLKKNSNLNPWLQPQSVFNDIQKVLRFLKKLPDRYEQLVTEINRIQRASIALKFFQLIDSLIQIFEFEAPLLPNYQQQPQVREQVEQILQFIRQTKQQIVVQQQQQQPTTTITN
ncbi:integrator complex subunit 14 [Dermatophagoides pteronyssinus]|uniref:integrator complex subunit 14 n=1 Tax=Dermatophagoides pteronyssinus TaxID=6956 RepID=UPI003F674AFF